MATLAYNRINTDEDFTIYTIQDEPIDIRIDENIGDGLLTFENSTRTIKNTSIGTSFLYYLSQS